MIQVGEVVTLKFEVGVNRKTGRPQVQAYTVEGGRTITTVVDYSSKTQPRIGDGSRWKCRVKKVLFDGRMGILRTAEVIADTESEHEARRRKRREEVDRIQKLSPAERRKAIGRIAFVTGLIRNTA